MIDGLGRDTFAADGGVALGAGWEGAGLGPAPFALNTIGWSGALLLCWAAAATDRASRTKRLFFMDISIPGFEA